MALVRGLVKAKFSTLVVQMLECFMLKLELRPMFELAKLVLALQVIFLIPLRALFLRIIPALEVHILILDVRLASIIP